MQWLLLVYRIPREPTASRVYDPRCALASNIGEGTLQLIEISTDLSPTQ